MMLSIVSTMYRSAPFLEEFCKRTAAAAEKVTSDYELILVNDGSPDDSLYVALGIQAHAPRVKIVDLSRNYGHHAAIIAGLEHACGNLVFLMDCDLEEQPEWLPIFLDELTRSSSDVVFGVQDERIGSRWSNYAGELFWRALNFMSSVNIPHNPMTCRLMKRKYVDALLGVGDRVLYLAGVFAWAGFKQTALPLTKTPRKIASASTYNLSRKLLQVVDSFSSFSVAPLTFIFLSGIVIWLGSIVFGAFLLAEKLINPGQVLSGFTSLMLSIWFLSGFIIVTLGIIGLYLAKIFQEVKRRPLFIVKDVYNGASHE